MILRPGRIAILLFLGASAYDARADEAPPRLLSWSEQVRVREKRSSSGRHESLLDDDAEAPDRLVDRRQRGVPRRPADQAVAPPAALRGQPRLLRVHRCRGEGPAAPGHHGFSEEALTRFFESPAEPQPADKVLPELYAAYQPKRIGLGISGRRGVMRTSDPRHLPGPQPDPRPRGDGALRGRRRPRRGLSRHAVARGEPLLRDARSTSPRSWPAGRSRAR